MSAAGGPVTVLPPPGQESPLGLDGQAPATKELVDREVRRIVDERHDEAVATLVAHRDQLNRLAHALFAKETLKTTRRTPPPVCPATAHPARSPAARSRASRGSRACRRRCRRTPPDCSL